MPCFHPQRAYRGKGGEVIFSRKYARSNLVLTCGNCIGCRLERSRQWAMRCLHEASLHEDNSFITLTYDEKNLPLGGTLVKQHFTKFIKRLRQRIKPIKIRYYMCGEYGDESSRAHYHALIFGYGFPDKISTKFEKSKGGTLFISEQLQSTWRYGISSVGEITFKSAAYVARYCTKKINGKAAEEHYKSMDISTGEIIKIIPEYSTMSRRPGIGKEWYEKYKDEIFPFDEIIINGHPVQPPKYYDNQLSDSDLYNIKRLRKLEAAKHNKDNTYQRLRDKEKVCEAKHKQLIRKL